MNLSQIDDRLEALDADDEALDLITNAGRVLHAARRREVRRLERARTLAMEGEDVQVENPEWEKNTRNILVGIGAALFVRNLLSR